MYVYIPVALLTFLTGYFLSQSEMKCNMERGRYVLTLISKKSRYAHDLAMEGANHRIEKTSCTAPARQVRQKGRRRGSRPCAAPSRLRPRRAVTKQRHCDTGAYTLYRLFAVHFWSMDPVFRGVVRTEDSESFMGSALVHT